MTQLAIYRSVSEFAAVADVWEKFRAQQPWYFPVFSDVVDAWQAAPSEMRAFALRNGDCITAIACFRHGRSSKKYTVGERKLLTLPFTETTLLGSSVLGHATPDDIATILKSAMAEWDCDLLTLGEIAIDSALYQAALGLRGGTLVSRVGRRDSIRWLIHLAPSFDEYLKSLGSATRSAVVRKLKKFERDVPYQLEVIDRCEQIPTFLTDGEKISRLTYQWNVGQRLCNDSATKQRYWRLAESGRMRCYMLYVDGGPAAFLRGELCGHLYHYETPGFDPKFQKLSPGNVLMMWVLRDLIENTDCKVFDFGTGGSDRDYKSQFGNVSIACCQLELGTWYKPYSLLLILLQECLSFVKNVSSGVLRNDRLRRQLKRAIRRYGARPNG